MEMTAYLAGLSAAFGLIVAIGPQNAFVISQGLKRRYVFEVCAVCISCDLMLISLGVLGLGAVVAAHPGAFRVLALSGSAMLLVYAIQALTAAMGRSQSFKRVEAPMSKRKTISSLLGVSLLNPHTYIDTVVLLGALSAAYGGNGRFAFGFGAMTASCVWFSGLAFGSSIAAPLFSSSRVRRIVDLSIGTLLLWSSWSLLHVAG